MVWLLFAFVCAIHVTLLALTFRRPAGAAEWLFRALLVGMATDNLIIALGPVGISTGWYESLNWVRYVAHAILLPPTVWIALTLLRRAGSVAAQGVKGSAFALGFIVAGISYGFAQEIVGLEFATEVLWEHPRLVSTHDLPPIATIVTNFLVIIMGGWLWRISGWPWLFVTALAIFLVNGGTATAEWGIVAGNFAEVVFAIGWFASLRRFPAN